MGWSTLAPVRSILTFLLLGRRHPFEHQLLHSCGGLRDVDIAFGIGRDMMAGSQNAGRLDRADDFERLAIDDGNAFAVADVEELLLRVRRTAPDSRANGIPVLISCFMNLPSVVNIWTRRFSRSAT